MKRNHLLVVMLFAMASVTACSSSNDPAPPPVEPPPPPPQPVVFSDFVKDQFDNTADDTDPVEVDETDFAFDDADDPDAFDDLLANP